MPKLLVIVKNRQRANLICASDYYIVIVLAIRQYVQHEFQRWSLMSSFIDIYIYTWVSKRTTLTGREMQLDALRRTRLSSKMPVVVCLQQSWPVTAFSYLQYSIYLENLLSKVLALTGPWPLSVKGQECRQQLGFLFFIVLASGITGATLSGRQYL